LVLLNPKPSCAVGVETDRGKPGQRPNLTPPRASQSVAVGSGVAVGAAQAGNGTFYIRAKDQYGFDLTQPASGTFRLAFYNTVPLFGLVQHVSAGLYVAKYYASTTGKRFTAPSTALRFWAH
jgi:hypothetical protein